MSRRTKHLIELRNVSCTRTETGISSSVHDVSVELTPGILVRPRERRVECGAGKIVCDVTP